MDGDRHRAARTAATLLKVLFVTVLAASLFGRAPFGSADELDELLSGFDETGQAENDLDDLLDGFERGKEAEPVGGDLDDLLGGFDEPAAVAAPGQRAAGATLPDWLRLRGGIGILSSVNFAAPAPAPGEPDYRGLSLLRTTAELIADLSPASWRARLGVSAFYDGAYSLTDQRPLYTDAFLDEYETEIEINEAYVEKRLSGSLDFRFGRQIVVWGTADNVRVTDILNPLDLRLPGLVDIRFLRLPVTMSKLDWYRGAWNLAAIVIHEPRFNKIPVFNGAFFPLDGPLPPADEPGVNLENQQAGLAVNGIFTGWDLSLYAASVFDEKGRLAVDRATGTAKRVYDRVLMTGAAANLAAGNWLCKGELAYWDGIEFTNLESGDSARVDVMAGFDYTGFRDITVSLEVANRHLVDFSPELELAPDNEKENWSQYALRYDQDFLNDTLHLTMLVSTYGLFAADGGFGRFQLEYDLTDAVTVTGGVVLYQSGDFPAFAGIGDNDRVLVELEYRF